MPSVKTVLKKLNQYQHQYDQYISLKKKNVDFTRAIQKIGFFLYFPYKWLVFMPWFVLSTAVLSVVCVLLSVLINPGIGSRCTGPLWGKMICYLTPVFIRIKGREHIDPHTSYVVVSNHESFYDIFIVYGWLGIDFKWVMKKSIRKIPGIGIACEKMDHIFIDRSNSQEAVACINTAKTRIKNGTSVFFFPEGTRSRNGDIQRFKKGAFKMALDLKIPILPVTINHTHKILPKGSFALFPGKAELIIHPPIDTSGYTSNNLQVLMNTSKQIIQSAHKK
ncbi:MAG: lysophospholipid acyltransferase family protein [Thermodesulfobacteriota bacterium]|nr:lysophospholipid acyltransferase family protein [Thermodesulfobacteriota bacterium]